MIIYLVIYLKDNVPNYKIDNVQSTAMIVDLNGNYRPGLLYYDLDS